MISVNVLLCLSRIYQFPAMRSALAVASVDKAAGAMISAMYFLYIQTTTWGVLVALVVRSERFSDNESSEQVGYGLRQADDWRPSWSSHKITSRSGNDSYAGTMLEPSTSSSLLGCKVSIFPTSSYGTLFCYCEVWISWKPPCEDPGAAE